MPNIIETFIFFTEIFLCFRWTTMSGTVWLLPGNNSPVIWKKSFLWSWVYSEQTQIFLVHMPSETKIQFYKGITKTLKDPTIIVLFLSSMLFIVWFALNTWASCDQTNFLFYSPAPVLLDQLPVQLSIVRECREWVSGKLEQNYAFCSTKRNILLL